MKPITALDVKNAELTLLKKRLEAMALLAHTLNKAYVTDAYKPEVTKLIDEISNTEGGKFNG